jgi:hypothetical protein
MSGHPEANERADEKARLRQDVEQARQQLGDTVEALAHKANVSERAKSAADRAVAMMPQPARRQVAGVTTYARRHPVVVTIILLILFRWMRRRGRSS